METNNTQSKGGPKTEEGKAVSRYNAVKHGLFAKEILMEGEDEEELLQLGKKLREQYKPKTEIEFVLVDRIVSGIWRLKRLLGLEEKEVFTRIFNFGLSHDADYYFRYEVMLERSTFKALHELERIQDKRDGKVVPSPVVVDVDVNNPKELDGFVS
jgi:hypothetical protein